MNLLTKCVLVLTEIVICSVVISVIDTIEIRTTVRMMNARIEHLERDMRNMNRPISIEDIATTNGYHVIVGRDPLDNMPMLGMPMLGMDENGAIIPL